jgi:hypothetical protein
VQQSIEQPKKPKSSPKRRSAAHGAQRRQGGVTTYEQAKSLHTIWANRGATTLTLAHDRDSTDKIFGITQRAIDEFDPALLPRLGRKRRARSLSPVATRASTPAPPAPGAPAADLTIVRLHGSEFAFWNKPLSTLNTVGPALVPRDRPSRSRRRAAASIRQPHHFWKEAVAGRTATSALFYPLVGMRSGQLPAEARRARRAREARRRRAAASRQRTVSTWSRSSGAGSRSPRCRTSRSSCRNTPRILRRAGWPSAAWCSTPRS